MVKSRKEYAAAVLGGRYGEKAARESAEAFMPATIALVKYWGKRDAALNLPLVSSLSYTLDGYGTRTRLSLAEKDTVALDGRAVDHSSPSFAKVMAFLDIFRAQGERYRVETENNIPTAAGVASSASGFAALAAAIVRLKGWEVSLKEHSMLARLGSGSAARSFWPGLVLWHRGEREDGMDCYAEPVTLPVQDFHMAVLLLSWEQKAVSSRDAMKASLDTSPLAPEWAARQQAHLEAVLEARDFATLGTAAEDNAVLMHRLIESSVPPIVYDLPETTAWKQKVRQWRAEGMPVYFTQDAGPNLKIILHKSIKAELEQKLKSAPVDYFMV